jgi:hypothetical protein
VAVLHIRTSSVLLCYHVVRDLVCTRSLLSELENKEHQRASKFDGASLIPKGSSMAKKRADYIGRARIMQESSLGLGSVKSEDKDRITLKIERAGDQLFLRMSIQTPPRSEMFMWYMLRSRRKRTSETDLAKTKAGIPSTK